MNRTIFYISIGTVGIIVVFIAVWLFFFRSPAPTQTNTADNNFEVPANSLPNTTNNAGAQNATQAVNTPGQVSQQKIFLIAAGPVVGATLIQTLHPTTTLARYINQEDGHVYDLPLDVPGAVPRVVSNVTIPGGARALWVEGGNAAVMQYLDGDTVKSVYLGFPLSTSTTAAVTLPTRIQFLPDAIVDIAASPDGKSVAYLLKTSSGVDGYTAKDDGTGSKKLFSLPLSQMLISWPSQGTLMAQTKSAAGVPGILFSIDVKSGVVTPLVYAPGLTAIADSTFTHIIYQTISSDSVTQSTYSHTVKTNTDAVLPFNPSPEKCLWGGVATSTLYCAAPISYVAPNYLDLWHQGATSVADGIFAYSITQTRSALIAFPGSIDGGIASDILEMALSPDGHYLSFTTKGTRAVWGVRLTQ